MILYDCNDKSGKMNIINTVVNMLKHWYIVQVFRGQEDIFVNRLKDYDEYFVFVPKRVVLLKRKDGMKKVFEPMFPGYVFVASDMDFISFKSFYQQSMSIIDGCIRILKHKDDVEALYPHERDLIERFINPNQVIDVSHGFIEGDKIRIIDGPLIGKESMIVKLNRHKRTAWIEISLLGEKRSIELSCEIITKMNENN